MIVAVIFVGAVLAGLLYFPLLACVVRRDKMLIARRRPINEILNDALAAGRITEEEWSAKMDEVHAAMPSIHAPYPKVTEFEEHKL